LTRAPFKLFKDVVLKSRRQRQVALFILDIFTFAVAIQLAIVLRFEQFERGSGQVMHSYFLMERSTPHTGDLGGLNAQICGVNKMD
jgi:hypothetical protein